MSQKDLLRDLKALVAAYEATPKQAKDKLPVVKVEAWGVGFNHIRFDEFKITNGIWHGSYTFTDQPDWRRLIRETFGEGAEVVRVTPVKGEMRDDDGELSVSVLTISKYIIEEGWDFLDTKYHGWYSDKENPEPSGADIEAAIREHHAADANKKTCLTCSSWNGVYCERSCYGFNLWKPRADAPKSKYKKGERFTGKVWEDTPIPNGKHLEYTGELRPYIEDDWVIDTDRKVVHVNHNGDWRPYEILTLVPDKPEPKYTVGQWVVTNIGLMKISDVVGNTIWFGNAYNQPAINVRPAVPADFERTVGNMRVRAYETHGLWIFIVWSDDTRCDVSEAVVAALGYPIIPLSVSGGKFEAPK